MSSQNPPAPTVQLRRPDDGRWLCGVCAGLAPVLRINAHWVRLAFAGLALLGGVGIALYLACWLIIPAEGDGAERERPSEIVVFAQACAACAGLLALAVLGAVATVFGFGWIVLGLAAVMLAGALAGWGRLGPASALLPVAALTLPAVAVAAGSLRLAPRAGQTVTVPARIAQVRDSVYRSGLNTMLIDLRRVDFPAQGVVPLRIDAGVRRTIVALPQHACVHVVVHYDVHPLAALLGAMLTGSHNSLFSDLVLFGRVVSTGSEGTALGASSLPGPVLAIDFSSQGGSLYVRDYPQSVDPDVDPNWPGFQVFPEPRPDTKGLNRGLARMEIRAWHRRLALELTSKQAIDTLLPGPCAAPKLPAQVPVRALPPTSR